MFEGLTVAMVTPFRNGGLDLEATGQLIEFLIDGGVEGLVISGSTGEAATCTVEERRTLWMFARDQVRKRGRQDIRLDLTDHRCSLAVYQTVTMYAHKAFVEGAHPDHYSLFSY